MLILRYIPYIQKKFVYMVFLFSKKLIRGPPTPINKQKIDRRIKMDIRPKRKRSKDNPYILKTNNNKYYVILNKKEIEINETIFNEMDKFELEDISQMHKYDRHIEHSELYDETLNKRAFNKQTSIEEIVETKLQNERLYNAINKLSDTKKRRIMLYFFKELTQREIALKEGTSIRAIQYTLNAALEELQKNLKN